VVIGPTKPVAKVFSPVQNLSMLEAKLESCDLVPIFTTMDENVISLYAHSSDNEYH